MEKIVIAGLGSAGYAAVMGIKRKNPKAVITVVDPKEFDLLHPCGLPYSLEGIVAQEELHQDINLSRMGVDKVTGRAKQILAEKKTLLVETAGGEEPVEYTALIIATGNRLLIPKIPGLESALGHGLYPLMNTGDLSKIKNDMAKTGTGIVIGAGAIGLETAVALKKHMETIKVLEGKDFVLPGVLDPDMAKVVEEYLGNIGIELVTKTTVMGIEGDNSFSGVVANNEKIEAGVGILATGFTADTTLAESSGLEYTANGITVDRFLKTGAEGVYAAGDAVSGWSVIDGSLLGAKLATSAYKQGTIAGVNALGEAVEYRGSAGTFVTMIGELEVAGTGFTTEQAKARGYNPASGKIKTGILPEYYPGNREISIKVIFDKTSGRLLGAQAIGEKGAAERVNIVSAGIEFGIRIDEISRLELAYCPAVSEVYDPLLRAVDFGLRRMKR
ncbi:MAG: FAD-dependent oxidoreductase [bacterium]|nr:FAD-dependent oxidoreductase [bacterium]